MILTAAERYEEAIASYGRMIDMPPWGHAYLAICHERLGRLNEARACAAKFVTATDVSTVTSLMGADPYRDQVVVERFKTALVNAGVPE